MNANLLAAGVVGLWTLTGGALGVSIYRFIKAKKAQDEFTNYVNYINESAAKIKETAAKAGINLNEQIDKIYGSED